MIGTSSGLFVARSDDRRTWTLDGPTFLMEEVAAVAVDARRSPARLLAGTMSWHFGPTLVWSDDLGATWHEGGNAAIAYARHLDGTATPLHDGCVVQVLPSVAGG